MHAPPSTRSTRNQRGLTLVEVTLVISVLLGLIGFAFVGVSAYKRGSDRAMCILHVTKVQKALRSFCNFQQYEPGDAVPGLKEALIGNSRYIQTMPVCPNGGTYIFYEDSVPPLGTTFMSCSLTGHTPATTYRW